MTKDLARIDALKHALDSTHDFVHSIATIGYEAGLPKDFRKFLESYNKAAALYKKLLSEPNTNTVN